MPRHWLSRLRTSRARTVITCMAVGLIVGLTRARDVRAQSEIPASVQRRNVLSAQQRAELYRTLQKHAQVIEAQTAVVKTVAKLVGPAVVHVEADVPSERGRTYSRRRQIEEAGSGVIIRLGGKFYVLTNRHVIYRSKPEGIKINLADGRQIHPVQFWTDAETDIAVMAVDAPGLVAARLGDSDKMEVGDFVLAVGSPFGLTHSVTYGIVSAKGRRDLQLGEAEVRFQDFIQTDASINPGNSGGPLINLRAEIVGINSAIASNSGHNEGIGFAIPINMFMIVGRQLIERGRVSRAFLGVNLEADFGQAMAAELGLPGLTGTRVSGIINDAPAEAADIRIGDVILEFNGIRVEDDAHLMNLVSLTEIGKKVRLVVFRDRKPIVVQVEVGDRAKF